MKLTRRITLLLTYARTLVESAFMFTSYQPDEKQFVSIYFSQTSISPTKAKAIKTVQRSCRGKKTPQRVTLSHIAVFLTCRSKACATARRNSKLRTKDAATFTSRRSQRLHLQRAYEESLIKLEQTHCSRVHLLLACNEFRYFDKCITTT